jgi:hypothetical protein
MSAGSGGRRRKRDYGYYLMTKSVDTSLETHVASKQRGTDHDEVLTGRREVNAMLDLVKQETDHIVERFKFVASIGKAWSPCKD